MKIQIVTEVRRHHARISCIWNCSLCLKKTWHQKFLNSYGWRFVSHPGEWIQVDDFSAWMTWHLWCHVIQDDGPYELEQDLILDIQALADWFQCQESGVFCCHLSISTGKHTHTQALTSCWFRKKTASFAWVHCKKSSYTPIRKTLWSSFKLLCSKSCLVLMHGKLQVGDEQEKSVSEPMWHRVAVRTGGLCTRWSEVQRVPESASWLWSLGRAPPKHP